MIPTDLIEKISSDLKIKEPQLIEKDLYLQALLTKLSKSNYFSEKFVFKGGTCLTKAYFGYYRFSEDLDFTWINQKIFEKKSEKQIRKLLSKEINKILMVVEKAAQELSLEFKPLKSNEHYIQLGGSNKFVTLKLWYTQAKEKRKTFLKIQLNFVDKIFHKPKKRKLNTLLEKQKEELRLEYPEYSDYTISSPNFYCYDLKEIAAEKIRALLTRRGFKTRDIIDLYYLNKEGITIKTVKKMAIEKTLFMLKYLKYEENLKNKKFEENFLLGEEEQLTIEKINKSFEKFTKKTFKQLNELIDEIKIKTNKKMTDKAYK